MARKYARSVLVIGSLTAIATSASEPYTRQADSSVADVEVGEVVHFTVFASEQAHLHAESFTVTVQRLAPTPGFVRVLPDDERFEPLTTGFSRVCSQCSDADVAPADDDGAAEDDDGGNAPPLDAAVPDPVFQSYEAKFAIEHKHCPKAGECSFGLSVEVLRSPPPALNTKVEVKVSARLERESSGQFFCPPDRDFPDGATVRVIRDDE
jgi:hypothetical protein